MNQRRYQRVFRFGPDARICACKSFEQTGNAPGGLSFRPVRLTGSPQKVLGCSLDRGNILLIGRRWLLPWWRERGPKSLRGALQRGDFLLLVDGNEAT